MAGHSGRRDGTRRYALALAAGALAAVLGGLGVAVALDDTVYRLLTRWSSPVGLPPVTVVGLDGTEPWRNDRIADLLEQLQAAGVRGIALDLHLRGNAGDPEGDARLARALLDPRMVLGVALQSGTGDKPRAVMPPVEFADAARLGHARLPLGHDGRVREHLPHVISVDGIRWPSLALALVRSGDAVGAGRLETPARWRVAYGNGGRAAPRTLHASDVLRGRAGAGVVGDQWILVGSTDPARLARVPGPFGSPALYPVEHQARALASLLDGTVAAPLPAALQTALSLLLAGGAALAGLGGRPGPWRMPLALLGGIAASLLAAAVLMHGERWFAPGGVLLVLVPALLACGAMALRRRLRDRRRMPGLATGGRLAAALQAARARGTAHALLLLEVPGGMHGTAWREWDTSDACRVARLLQSRARRPGDLAAHLGGGRFALLLPDTSAASAERILEDIRTQASTAGAPRLAGHVHACTGEECDCVHRLAGRPMPASAAHPAR